jgi:hypothetical protein
LNFGSEKFEKNEIASLVRGWVLISAAIQVESGLSFEWNRVSIYRGNDKENVIKVVCMNLDNPCMGLHDHAQGPKPKPNAT